MKKLFTLIAAALMTMGASAQTITFDETGAKAAGEVPELTLGTDDFKVTFVGGSKAKIESKSLTFKVDEAAEAENFQFQWCPGGGITKTSGERSVTITVTKKGTLTIYPRSASSDDRTFTVEQGGSQLLSGTAYTGFQFEDKYYKAYAVEVAAGTVNIKATDAINISALKFEASADQGGSEEGGEQEETDALLTYTISATTPVMDSDKNMTNGDGWTADDWSMTKEFANGKLIIGNGSKVLIGDALTAKNANFTQAAGLLLDGGPGETATKYVAVEMNDAFQAGDVIDLVGFCSGNPTGSIGFALYNDRAGENAVTTLPFTTRYSNNEVSYTVKEDDNLVGKNTLYVYRMDTNSDYFLSITIKGERTATAITTVKAETKQDGKWYTISGQQVAAPVKGLYIHNGKKYIVK